MDGKGVLVRQIDWSPRIMFTMSNLAGHTCKEMLLIELTAELRRRAHGEIFDYQILSQVDLHCYVKPFL